MHTPDTDALALSPPAGTLPGDPLGSQQLEGADDRTAHVDTSGRFAVKRMLLNASATAVLQASCGVMMFGLAVLLARLLGSGGYGRYAVAFAWASLLTTPAILGLDRFLVRGMAVYEAQDKWSLMKGLLLRTNELVLVTSCLIAAGGCAIALISLSASARTPFCIAMLLVPLTSLTLLRQGAMQALGRVVSGQFPEYLIRPLLIIAGVAALRWTGHGLLTPASALMANVAGVGVAFLVGIVLLRRALPASVRSAHPTYTTGAWLRASLPMMLISGVWMANNYASTLIVGALQGARAAGVYSAVQKGSEVIVLALAATNMALAPTVARLHANNDKRNLEHATERMARATLLASAPLAFAFMAFPHLYLDMFGHGFHSGASALMVIALGQLINAAAGPAGNVLIMTGKESTAVWGVAAGLLANIALALTLVPLLGVTGGAIAFASSLVLWNTILVVMARRVVHVNVTALGRLSLHR